MDLDYEVDMADLAWPEPECVPRAIYETALRRITELEETVRSLTREGR